MLIKKRYQIWCKQNEAKIHHSITEVWVQKQHGCSQKKKKTMGKLRSEFNVHRIVCVWQEGFASSEPVFSRRQVGELWINENRISGDPPTPIRPSQEVFGCLGLCCVVVKFHPVIPPHLFPPYFTEKKHVCFLKEHPTWMSHEVRITGDRISGLQPARNTVPHLSYLYK